MKKFTTLTLETYLNELSGPEPVPGGGSASAYVAALALGLTQMVGRISVSRKKKQGLSPEDNKKDDDRRGTIQHIIDAVEKLKRDAFRIVDLDPEVYAEVMAASGDPAKMEASLLKSYQLQADLVSLVALGRDLNEHMMDLVNGSIKNDLEVSAGMLAAAFHGAYHTANINVVYMKDAANRSRAESVLGQLKSRFERKPA